MNHEHMPPAMVRAIFATAVLVVLSACGGSGDKPSSAPPTDPQPAETTTSAAPTEAAPVADACSLLDKEFLTKELSGVRGSFDGTPLDFREPLQTSPTAYCEWKDASGAFSIRLTVEDSSVSETEDHSGRAYNIDVEPTVEPQDGPGEKAVILLDTAFVKTGNDPLAYGFFFVEGDAAVFIRGTGLDMGTDVLQTLADEADTRLTAS